MNSVELEELRKKVQREYKKDLRKRNPITYKRADFKSNARSLKRLGISFDDLTEIIAEVYSE